MFEKLLNLNIETCPEAELKAWLRQVVPIVIKFIKASTRYIENDDNTCEVIPCGTCPKKDTCNGEPCDALEAFLDSIDRGKGYKEKTIGISLENFKDINTGHPDSYHEKTSTPNRDKLKTIKTTRLTDVYEKYENYRDIFTDTQWEIVSYRYSDGMTQKQIAEATGKKRSTVSDLLKRAKDRIEEHEKKLRAERFFLLRNKETE